MPEAARDLALPSVLQYSGYREYMEAWLEVRRQQNSGYTLTRFARRASCSPSHVRNVLSGERDLLPPYVEAFCKALHLNEDDAAFFTLMVRHDQSTAPTERAWLALHLQGLRVVRGAHRTDQPILPYLTAQCLHELLWLPDFREDLAWIADMLSVSQQQAAEALACLEAAGLVTRVDGRLQRPSSYYLYLTPENEPCLRLIYEHACSKAQASLTGPAEGQAGMVLVGPLSKARLAALHKALNALQDRVIGLFTEQQLRATQEGGAPLDVLQLHVLSAVPLARLSDPTAPSSR